MAASKTIVLKDKSIADIYSDGHVLLYPNVRFWKQPKNKRYHQFQFSSQHQAEQVLNIINGFISP